MDNVTTITRQLGELAKQRQDNPDSEFLRLVEKALACRLEYLLSSAKQQAA